jgi:phosphoserine phosphatase
MKNCFSEGLIVRDLNKLSSPLCLNNFKLIAFDMDSTLINIECIDEIANACGRKEQVAQITEATMRGEITDFQDSLGRRLQLLAGVHTDQLKHVLMNILQLNPGAEILVSACRAAGLKVLLVSGGFTYFANYVKKLLSIDYVRANELEIIDNALTGGLITQSWGSICDGLEKRRALLDVASFIGASTNECIAVGDGANDIAMLQSVGLSVAYHAKQKVREIADISIEQGGLDQLLEVFDL